MHSVLVSLVECVPWQLPCDTEQLGFGDASVFCPCHSWNVLCEAATDLTSTPPLTLWKCFSSAEQVHVQLPSYNGLSFADTKASVRESLTLMPS